MQPASGPSSLQDVSPTSPQTVAHGEDVLATIEKLAELRAKGILSNEEFSAKKAELLGRI